MKTENIYCDFCKKKTTDDGKKVANVNGFVATVGYSLNGWGSRKDFVDQSKVEICDDCFKEVETASKNLMGTINKLKKYK